MEELQKKLAAIVNHMQVTFTMKGSPITTNELFSETGLMPGLAKRADQLASLCFGYGLGATYNDVEKSLLGSSVEFDTFTPDLLRVFCIVDVLHEIVRNSPERKVVSLDELMYD
jgi:intracellular multiplication protein IcmS